MQPNGNTKVLHQERMNYFTGKIGGGKIIMRLKDVRVIVAFYTVIFWF